MADTPKKEIKLFYCYARKDKSLRDELEIQLSWLKRRYQLINWHDHEILPGEEWEQAIDKHLNTAQLILLLISPDFMASDYCYSKEMQRALERHKTGTCRVVPILLRPTYWEDAPFSSIQLLPTNAKPITSWSNSDEAFQDVVKEISRTIKDLLVSLKTKEEWCEEGNALYGLKHYMEAVIAFDQALRLDPNCARALQGKGDSLNDLKQYDEALTAYNQAISLNPGFAEAYNGKGWTLNNLMRYQEALITLDKAIRLDPSLAWAYHNKGIAYTHLNCFDEALTSYELAVLLDPNFAWAYNGKGIALYHLKRYDEALASYELALLLDPSLAVIYYNKGIALRSLKRYDEAKQAIKKAQKLGFAG